MGRAFTDPVRSRLLAEFLGVWRSLPRHPKRVRTPVARDSCLGPWHGRGIYASPVDAGVVVGIVSAVIALVGAVIAYLQLRRTPKATVTAGHEVLDPLVVGDIPREPLSFRRRKDLDARIERALAAQLRAVLVGPRGVGKTHLAAAHARSCGGIVVWVVADDPANVVSALVDIAKASGLADEVVDARITAKEALRHLEDVKTEVLFVFDNAVDVDAVEPWLPRRGSARVLITTTNHDFAILGGVVHVGGFDRAEAVAFLCARADREPGPDADALAVELGLHPLALAQAGWVIRKRKLRFAEYLARFRTTPLDTLLVQVPGEDYPRSGQEATLWSIAEVEDPTGLANCILDFLCAVSAAGVRRELLRLLSDGDIDAVLGALAGASLIGFDVSGEVIAMHRLTRRVVLDRAQRDNRLSEVAQTAVAVLMKATRAENASTDLIDHIASVWALARNSGTNLADALEIRRWSVRRAFESGDLTRSVTLAAEVAEDHKNALPDGDPRIAETRLLLRRAYASAGRWEAAIVLAEEDYQEHVRRFGADHPSTLGARNDLGYLCEWGGRLDRAEEVHRVNLADALRVCGPDDQTLLLARINLASTYRSMGRLDEAVALFEENLCENVRIHGEEHPSTVNARGELARTYVRVGRAEEGVALHEANREYEHDGLRFYWWPQYRAAAYSAVGRHDDAITLLRELCARADAELPKDNPDAIRIRLFLARAFLAAGRTTDANKMFERVAADRERVLGPDHYETLNARRNLAQAFAREGRTRSARKAFTAVVADYDRVLGPDHPYSRGAREDLAVLQAQ